MFQLIIKIVHCNIFVSNERIFMVLFLNKHVPNYPITTSSTIIKTKPTAKPMVLRLEC